MFFHHTSSVTASIDGPLYFIYFITVLSKEYMYNLKQFLLRSKENYTCSTAKAKLENVHVYAYTFQITLTHICMCILIKGLIQESHFHKPIPPRVFIFRVPKKDKNIIFSLIPCFPVLLLSIYAQKHG